MRAGDESSRGLELAWSRSSFDTLLAAARKGTTVLMVEQKARQCLAIADYGYVLDQGRNRLEGSGQALLQDPEVVRLYLGVRSGRERPAP